MDIWKTRCGTLWHSLAPDIPAAGHFTVHVQESVKCYRPKVRDVRPGIHAMHHLVNYTLHHTLKHRIGPHARFGGVLVLRRSLSPSSPQNSGTCAPAGLPP